MPTNNAEPDQLPRLRDLDPFNDHPRQPDTERAETNVVFNSSI